MYCPSCAKKVPDESVFCLHCGARISNAVISQMVIARETPPVAIENLFLELCGSTDVRKKGAIFTSMEVGRGLKFGFSLTDSNNRPTVSDGKLFAALRESWWNYSGEYGGNEPLESTIREAMHRVKSRRETKWYKVIEVSKIDFKEQNQIPFYTYTQLEPLVYILSRTFVYLHVWFVTPDKKCLYKISAQVYWN